MSEREWLVDKVKAQVQAETNDALRYQKRLNRDLKRHLAALTAANLQFLQALDDVMRGPSTPERGAKIARLSNFLDMANDRARYHGLGINYRDDDKKAAMTNAVRVAADQFAEVLREHWAFDDHQQHTHSWHSREDFIERILPTLLALPATPGRQT